MTAQQTPDCTGLRPPQPPETARAAAQRGRGSARADEAA